MLTLSMQCKNIYSMCLRIEGGLDGKDGSQERNNGDFRIWICHRIRSKLEKEKQESRNCFPVPSTNMVFQASRILDQLHVDMKTCSCTYRKWDMKAVSCYHTILYATWSIGVTMDRVRVR